MIYEISREIFKQRLKSKLNFEFVHTAKEDSVGSQIKGSKNITFGQDFSNKLSSEIQDKDTNIVLYSFDEGDNSPKEAANTLKADGYTNVYYYMGIADDLILDKRIN